MCICNFRFIKNPCCISQSATKVIKNTCSFSPPIKLFHKGVAQKTTLGAIKKTCLFSLPIKFFCKGVAKKTTSGALWDKQVLVNNIRVHVYLLWVAKFKFKQNAPLDILLCESKLSVDCKLLELTLFSSVCPMKTKRVGTNTKILPLDYCRTIYRAR